MCLTAFCIAIGFCGTPRVNAADPPAVASVPQPFTEAALLAATPPGPYMTRTPPVSRAKSNAPLPPQIATAFLYNFDDKTGAGLRYNNGIDALSMHPAQTKGYSYKNALWHRRELTEMRAAGVDIALCNYWGNPADRALEKGQGLRWSFDGVGPMVQAATQMNKTNRPAPKIGLAFSAGSLVENAAHYQPDLATNDGRAWLYVSLRDFYSLVPPKLRATGPNGGPLIFVTFNAPFVKNGVGDTALWEYVRAHFANDFGVEPSLILQNGWLTEAQRQANKEATFPQVSPPKEGLRQTSAVAAIGPGVDLKAQPGNKYGPEAIFRDRENGAFYDRQWQLLLAQSPVRRPRLVVVESWNQWQQATAIASSREYGDKYVRLTRKWADLFHSGARKPLPASGAFHNADRISWFAAASSGANTASGTDDKGGLRLVSPPDGQFSVFQAAPGGAYIEARDNLHGMMNHIGFDVSDGFLYDADDVSPRPTPLTLTFEYWDEGRDLLRVQYDATENGQAARSGDDAGFTLSKEFPRTDTHTWKTATVVLPYPRFANRQNGGGDFRFQSDKTAPLRLRWVTLRRAKVDSAR